MILTCPACSTRYLLGAAAIGATGRMVRCAKCGHTWHADAPPAEDKPAPPPAAPAPGPALEQAPSEDSVEAASEPALREPLAGPAAEAAKVLPAVEALPQRLRPIPHGSGLPALPGEARRPLPIGWILFVLVVTGVVAGLALGRDAIVTAWPPANRFYASLGSPAELPGMGLEFRSVVSTRAEENGRPVLVVRGLIANIMNVQRPVPQLRVALKDDADRRVQEWSFKADAATVEPGESLPFETRIVDPSEQARGLTIEFVAPP